MNRFTTSACNVLKTALSTASELGHTYIGSEHLLLGLLSEKNTVAYKVLSGHLVTFERCRDALLKSSGKGVKTELTASDMTPKTKSIIENAYHAAYVYGCESVATEHLLLSLIREEDCVGAKIIASQGVELDGLDAEISSHCSGSISIASPFSAAEKNKRKGSAFKSGAYGKNLTELAFKGKLDPVIGREAETLRVIQILSRRTKNNPVLIGEPGVGKTAVVEGLAQLIATGNVPENLLSAQIYSLDITSLIAGAKYRGEFEERFKQIIDEASNNKSIILFIDEIHNLVGAGAAEGAIDGANILKPVLARGQLQLIGATTVSEYRKIEKDAALERRFQSVNVEEATVEQTVSILKGLRDKYEAHHKLKITDQALSAAAILSKRYINDRFLPDKALDLIDEACARVKVAQLIYPESIRVRENRLQKLNTQIDQALSKEDFALVSQLRKEQEELFVLIDREKADFKEKAVSTQLQVDSCDIERVVTEWTGIPVSSLASQEKQRLMSLESRLSERIKGQNEALSVIAETVRRGRLGLRREGSPMASFIFAGPSGVGKTECAKALAGIVFGGGSSIITLDMSEYSEKHSISKLIGAPAGYVGYEEGGHLTEKVRRRPYSVVLFDEIEKAHPDICNLLLQILDEGRLSDSMGRAVDFSNTLVILTTNLGAELFKADRTAGFGASSSRVSEGISVKSGVKKELSRYFKAELLGRIDETVIFSPLSSDAISEISRIYLELLCKRLEKSLVDASYTNKCLETVAGRAFSKEQGARQIERYIRNNVEKVISNALLSGDLKEKDHISLDFDDDLQEFVIIHKSA